VAVFSRRVRSWLDLVDRLIPHELHRGDPVERRRARSVVFTTAIFVAYGLFHGVMEVSVETPARAAVGLGILSVGLSSGVATLAYLQRRMDPQVSARITYGTLFFVLITLTWLKGGLRAPGLPWFVVMPVVARATLGSKSVFWAGAITLAVVLGFALLDALDVAVPAPPTGAALAVKRAVAIGGASILCAGLVYMNGVFEDDAQSALVAMRDAATGASRAKSLFVANVSHEIRTPMTAILGYTDVLAEPDLRESERREAIETLRRNGKHLLGLINDMLDLSKIEAGGLELRKRDASPLAIAQQVVALLRERARAKGLALDLETGADLPATVWTDAMRLQQILVNLVGNAVKFTSQGGIRVVLGADEERGVRRLRVDVIDTGIGVAAADHARIFEPFSQVDASESRRFAGTGLGLAISRRLAEQLGGRLGLVSEVGAGSTFTLLLPIRTPTQGEREASARASARSEPAPRETPAAARPAPRLAGRVLVAEDGADNQRLIERLLTRAGLEVEIAADGRRAVERAIAAQNEARPFDAVLMDMQMPELDGFAATQALRDAGFTRPIIALSAHAMREDRDRCLAAGCDAFAPKPIDRTELLGLLAQHLSKSVDSER
jgi:signal transduction histidine kinase/ActR/RegA family two-component response regulator